MSEETIIYVYGCLLEGVMLGHNKETCPFCTSANSEEDISQITLEE